MSLTITNEDEESISLPLWGIVESLPTKSVVISIAGVDKDVVQKLGSLRRTYELTGVIRTLDEKMFLDNINGTTGKISFESVFDLIDVSMVAYTIAVEPDFDGNYFADQDFFLGRPSEIMYYVPVYFKELSWNEKRRRPFEYKFTISLIEVGVSS